MHILAEHGNADMASFVMKKVAHTEAQRMLLTDVSAMAPLTAIHIAAFKGHTQFVDMLLNLGVDVNIRSYSDLTPVMCAVLGGRTDVVRLLISRCSGRVGVHERCRIRSIYKTPIVAASQLGMSDIVDVLIDNKANVNEKVEFGMTALHAASWNGRDDVVKLLLTKGNAQIDQADDEGETALMYAASRGHMNTIMILTGHKASLHSQDKCGRTVFYHAALSRNDEFLNHFASQYLPSNVAVSDKVNAEEIRCSIWRQSQATSQP
jgi:ankyrin repeat protein